MIKKLFNLEHELVLLLLKGESHGRAIAKQLHIPLSTVQLGLKALAGKNVLESRTEGRNKIYSVKRNIYARQAVYSAEQYKLTILMGIYPYISPLIEDLIKARPSKLIILFGSYARFNIRKDSDIDLFVETTSIPVKKEVEDINSLLSVKIGIFNKEDLLIKEIIKNHVIIAGVEEYYDKFGFFG